MPVYEYVCPHCRKTFEEWLKIDEATAERPCPECGRAAPRVLSPTTFILKGSGWYATEYGSHREAAREEGTADGGNAAGKSADGKEAAASSGPDPARPKEKPEGERAVGAAPAKESKPSASGPVAEKKDGSGGGAMPPRPAAGANASAGAAG